MKRRSPCVTNLSNSYARCETNSTTHITSIESIWFARKLVLQISMLAMNHHINTSLQVCKTAMSHWSFYTSTSCSSDWRFTTLLHCKNKDKQARLTPSSFHKHMTLQVVSCTLLRQRCQRAIVPRLLNSTTPHFLLCASLSHNGLYVM